MIDTRTISLADIAPNTGQISGVPANPRIIQDGRFTKLVRSLKDDPEMMELRELLVYEQDGAFVVIGGNMRLKALKHIGATEAPCKVIPSDWPAEKLRAIATKDNVSFGEFDWDALVEGWDRGELEDWGVDFPAIAKPKKGLTDPDAGPPVTKEAVTRPGDIWVLGDHRIICGDSTKAEVVKAVMRGEKAEMVWTDPPYGVAIGDKNKWLNTVGRSNRIERNLDNDTAEEAELMAMLRGAFKHAVEVCLPGASWYVAAPAVPLHLLWGQALNELGIWRQTIQWVKNNSTFSPMGVAYHWQCEPIFFGWVPDGAKRFYGGRKQTTAWMIDRPSKSPLHPTMKPIELVRRSVANSSKPGDLVYEPFSGSGTTIIACEETGRKCRAIELAPEYVDVALKRWQEFTGKEAILMSTGETFAQRAEAQAITA